jgi:hypothetical protein
MRRGMLVCALAAVFTARLGGEEPSREPGKARLTDAQQERFLLEGQIVRTKSAPGGITASTRATLRLDGFEHDAHIQTIDQVKPVMALDAGAEIDFRDSYKNNVAAYRLDRLLGLGMVPVTVVREYDRREAAFTWWVDDVRMTEGERRAKKAHSPDIEEWNRQMYVVMVFDQLIYNFDRNPGNLLADGSWRVWMIDHTRAFKIFKELKNPNNLKPRCARGLFDALKRLEEPALRVAMKDLLSPEQTAALLARRDLIVRHFENVVAQKGEAAVLYDLPSRVGPLPAPP